MGAGAGWGGRAMLGAGAAAGVAGTALAGAMGNMGEADGVVVYACAMANPVNASATATPPRSAKGATGIFRK